MKIPSDVEYVIQLPPERIKKLRNFKPPIVGESKGIYTCEGFAITKRRFIALVVTCSCSGNTRVRFMTPRDWYGFRHVRCAVCDNVAPSRVSTLKGWGYI